MCVRVQTNTGPLSVGSDLGNEKMTRCRDVVTRNWPQTEQNRTIDIKQKPNQTINELSRHHLRKGKPNYLNQNRLGKVETKPTHLIKRLNLTTF